MIAMVTRMTTAVAVALLTSAVIATAQRNEAERERFERVADILAALGVREGAKIADLGSADGFYTVRLARAVGPTGRAYGVDISQKRLDEFAARHQPPSARR